LFTIIDIAMNFLFSNSICGVTFILAEFLIDYNSWGIETAEELFENYYFLFPLSAIVQSITYAFFMVLDFYAWL